MQRTLELRLDLDRMGDTELAEAMEALSVVLEKWKFVQYDEEGLFYIMDAGGKDDVALMVGALVSEQERQASIRISLAKWIVRPCDFRGMLQVGGFDEEEEEQVWAVHEKLAIKFAYALGKTLSDCNVPIMRNNGDIAVHACLVTDGFDSKSPEAVAERERKVTMWQKRMMQVKGS